MTYALATPTNFVSTCYRPQLAVQVRGKRAPSSRKNTASFSGTAGYMQAGGGIRRDLFTEGDAGTYLTDAALLETLVRGKLDAQTEDEGKVVTLEERREQVTGKLEAIEEALRDYSPDVRAMAGAIVTLDANGQAVIHRGLLREAETKALRTLDMPLPGVRLFQHRF